MKIKNYILMFAVTTAVFLTSCNNKPCPPQSGGTTGSSLQDTVLPKMLFKLVHEGSNYYFAYYWVSAMTVDTTQNPPKLTMAAQSACYNSSNSSSVLHNGSTTSQVSSPISVNTDTVVANTAGPFDVVNGQIYSYKGYLHYVYPKTAGATDSTICPVTEIVYYNQNGPGQPMVIGYVVQNDLHSPKPGSHP
jgi:hypothetical protein